LCARCSSSAGRATTEPGPAAASAGRGYRYREGADLNAVLPQIIEAARRLTRAEGAAVGVAGEGQLVRFVQAGMDPLTVAEIRPLPEGRSVLGWLLDNPESLRLRALNAHPLSLAAGDDDPPMRAFLGVPITARGVVLGNLYLTGKHGAVEFSAEDEELVSALATAAGVAIENAELFEETRRREAWQTATTNVTTLLLSGEDPQVILSVLVGHAAGLAGAAGAAITVPAEDPAWLRVAAGSGLLDPQSVGELIPAEGSISQLALTANSAIVTADLAADPRTADAAARAPGLGPAVAAPFNADAVGGVLLVARNSDDDVFQAPDVQMIASFAEHAGLALALADTRRKRELVRLGEDRERIAHHLSEQAMQALLGISTTVHGLTARMQRPDDAHRLAEQVDRLDGVLREMRRAIFELEMPPEELPSSAHR
jgi:GAF domain-containing protein